MIQAVGARLRPGVVAYNAPILTEEQVAKEAKGDEEAELVLNQLNAQRSVDQLYKGPDNLEVDHVDGYVAHLQHGALGLVRVAAA